MTTFHIYFLSINVNTNLSKSNHKSIIPILGNSRRILYQERGGSPCVSWIEHKSRIICHLTDASDTSDAKSSDTQIDDDNGRSHGGGGWSLKLGLSDASQASDANLGDWMTDTS